MNAVVIGLVAMSSSALAAPKEVLRATPALGSYTDGLLLDEVWSREGLSRRDRSLVTVAALVSMGKLPELQAHLGFALDHGVSPAELSESITHLAFYSGWPSGIQASRALDEVLRKRKLTVEPTTAPLLELDAEGESRRKAAVARSAAPVSPALAEYTDRVLFAEVWRRPQLAPRDRSLVTMAALIANGQAEQLPFHAERAMANGVTRAELGEVVAHLAFYCGWPRAFSALGPLRSLLEQPAPPAPGLVVIPSAEGKSFVGPPDQFTGHVVVDTPFAADAPGRAMGAMVHFDAGARTAWHRHALGQNLVVTEGVGWVQSEGQPRQTVRVGDVVHIPPGVRHWHGASSDAAMAHFAVLEHEDGISTEWLELVPDAVYEGQR